MKRKMQAHKSGGKSGSTTGLFGLRVVVVPDDKTWFAQGFDVDYFAAGETPDEAEHNFETGLKAMVELHLKKFGNLEHLKTAPADVREEYAGLPFQMKTRELSEVKAVAPQFPYTKVQYFKSS
jgi:hypothetical protein